ncbi:MAG: hypothetical protein ACOX6T_00765 [Myxococcales bacterium]|jgi:cytoskeletal protein CcmA (bactofilin family)
MPLQSRTIASLAVLAALLVVARPAAAFESRSGDTVHITADQTIDDDLYVFATTIIVEGTIQGDLVAFGQNITVSGTVEDLVAAGSNIRVDGTVNGSMRVAASDVTVAGQIAQDAVVASGDIDIEQGATVGRDAVLTSGELRMAGQVTRRLVVSAGSVELAGAVGSNARIESGELTVAPSASVGGNLEYSATDEAEIDPGARIGGEVVRLPSKKRDGVGAFAAFLLIWLRLLVGLCLVGLILVLALPERARRTLRSFRFRPGESLAVGLITMIVVPIVALAVLVLGFFIGGWWIALMILGAYLIVLAFALPATGLWIGSAILRRRDWTRGRLVGALALGLFLLMLVILLPFLGPAIAIVATIWGLGALLRGFGTRTAGELPA